MKLLQNKKRSLQKMYLIQRDKERKHQGRQKKTEFT